MAPAELGEYLFGWPSPTVSDVVLALAEGLIDVGARSDVKQSLIGFSVLHDSLGLAVHGQHYGTLGLLDLFEKLSRLTPEGRKRLNVFRDVDPGQAAPP
jgi:hypothetical protein